MRAGSSAWRHINYLIVVVCPLGFLFIFGVCVTRQCLYGKGVDPLTIDWTIQLCTRLSAGPKKVPQTRKHKTKKREEEERYSADDEGVPKFIRFTKKKLRQKKRKTKFYAFDLFFFWWWWWSDDDVKSSIGSHWSNKWTKCHATHYSVPLKVVQILKHLTLDEFFQKEMSDVIGLVFPRFFFFF